MQYVALPNISVPEIQPKGNYGAVKLQAVCSVFDCPWINEKLVWRSDEPKTFEFLNKAFGYVLYKTTIPNNMSDPAVLRVSSLRDRATVYVDEVSLCPTVS